MLVAATAAVVGCSSYKPEDSATPQFDLAAHCESREAILNERERPCNPDAALRRFARQSVIDFDRTMHAAKHGQVFLDPKEYSDVAHCGKPVVPGLIKLITNKNAYIGDAAWAALDEITNQRFGMHEVTPNPPDTVERAAAAEKYQKWWDENKTKSRTDWLVADIGLNDERGRAAIYELGYSGDRAAIPALKSLLGNRYQRPLAAVALAWIGDESAVPVLVDYYMASDSEPLRETGICEAYTLTGQTMDFNPKASPKERQRSINRWHRWYEQRVSAAVR